VELLSLYLSPVSRASFKVIARSSSVGEGDVQSRVPFREGRVDRHSTVLKTLDSINFRPEDFQRNGEQDWMVRAGLLTLDRSAFHPKRLVNIGRSLYKALFPSGKRVQKILEQSLAWAEGKNTQLHIQLQFAPDDVQIIRLPDYPWELMHDGQHFLAHYQVTFSRYIVDDTVPPNLSGVEQVNVLLVSSGASDEANGFPKLSKQEKQAIRKGLKNAEQEGHIRLAQLKCATINELRTYLTQHRGDKAPHVFHFDGHGCFGQRCNNEQCRKIHKSAKVDRCNSCGAPLSEPQGYLLFEEKLHRTHYVSAQEIGVLLHQASFSNDVSQQRSVALVVLSACKSALSLFSNSIYNGVAQSLISHRIPAVVAMQYNIKVSSATAFAEQFYRSLGQRDALALAVSQGRAAMGVEGDQWYRLVLYLRGKDNQSGQLFALRQESNIKQVFQEVSKELTCSSSAQPLIEITRQQENASRRSYYRKQAEIWLGDKNHRWSLASSLGDKILASKSLDIYQIQLLKEDRKSLVCNIYNCLNYLSDAFHAGKGKGTDKIKECLIEHSLEPYIEALNMLKNRAEKDFKYNIEVMDTIHRYIDRLIARISF
jgi:hypothetical protein